MILLDENGRDLILRGSSSSPSVPASLATFLTGERYPTSTATLTNTNSGSTTVTLLFTSTDYDGGDQVVISGSSEIDGTYTISKTNSTFGSITVATAPTGSNSGTMTFTHLGRGYFLNLKTRPYGLDDDPYSNVLYNATSAATALSGLCGGLVGGDVVRAFASTDCYINFASDALATPPASPSSMYFAAGTEQIIIPTDATYIQVVRVTADGTLNLTRIG